MAILRKTKLVSRAFWRNGRKLHLIHIFAFLTNPQCCHYMYRQRNAFSKELAKVNSPTNHLWDLGERNTLERMKAKKHRSPEQKPTTPAQSNLSSISSTRICKLRFFHNKHVTLWEPWSDSKQTALVTNTHNIHTTMHWASTQCLLRTTKFKILFMGNLGVKLGRRHGHWQLFSTRKM